MKTKILIINGPNLNLLGTREPEIYGNQSFESYLETLRLRFSNVQIDYFQSNSEGAIIDRLHDSAQYAGVVLNAGAYTHTSLAIADAIGAITTKVVEVHISCILAREPIRHTSLIAANCVGSIMGFGLDSYRLGISALIE